MDGLGRADPGELLYSLIGVLLAPRSACCRHRPGHDRCAAAAADLRPEPTSAFIMSPDSTVACTRVDDIDLLNPPGESSSWSRHRGQQEAKAAEPRRRWPRALGPSSPAPSAPPAGADRAVHREIAVNIGARLLRDHGVGLRSPSPRCSGPPVCAASPPSGSADDRLVGIDATTGQQRMTFACRCSPTASTSSWSRSGSRRRRALWVAAHLPHPGSDHPGRPGLMGRRLERSWKPWRAEPRSVSLSGACPPVVPRSNVPVLRPREEAVQASGGVRARRHRRCRRSGGHQQRPARARWCRCCAGLRCRRPAASCWRRSNLRRIQPVSAAVRPEPELVGPDASLFIGNALLLV